MGNSIEHLCERIAFAIAEVAFNGNGECEGAKMHICEKLDQSPSSDSCEGCYLWQLKKKIEADDEN